MAVSDDLVQRFKEVMEKKQGETISDEEAREGMENLAGLAEILWKGAVEDQKRKNRLKKEPDGFELEGSYSCCVCRNTAYNRNHLFTRWGINCRECYAALKAGIIPTFVALHRESFFLDWQLKSDFKIHPATVRKYVRQGILKSRIVLTDDGKPYEYIFLRKENPGLISRHSPARKSWDRNREKVSKRQSRKWKEEMRAEFKKKKASC